VHAHFFRMSLWSFHSMKTSKSFNTLWVLEKSLKMLFFFPPTNKINTFPKSKIKRKHSLKRRPIKYQTAKNWEGIWLIFTLIHVLKMPKVNLEFFKKKSWVRKPVFHWLNELSKDAILVSIWGHHIMMHEKSFQQKTTLELQITFSWGTINKNPWTLGCILDQ
jgi:hypothetical protein